MIRACRWSARPRNPALSIKRRREVVRLHLPLLRRERAVPVAEAALRVAGAPVVAAEEVVVAVAVVAAAVLLRQRRHRLLLQPLRLLQRLPPLPRPYVLHAIWPLVLLGMM